MGGVALLEVFDDTKGMQIVVEVQAVFAHGCIERSLAGVAEGRMTDVVDEREGLAEVFIEVERLRDGAGDLRHLQRVGEAAAEVVGGTVGKNLRLAGHAPERPGVGDAAAVALEGTAVGVDVFRIGADGKRAFAVTPAHRAGGEIQLTQLETGDSATHASSLTRLASHPGFDVTV